MTLNPTSTTRQKIPYRVGGLPAVALAWPRRELFDLRCRFQQLNSDEPAELSAVYLSEALRQKLGDP